MIHNIKVPFMDLKAQHESIYDEVFAAIEQVLKSCAFAGGPFVEQFDKEFAAFCGTKYAVGVGSGTEALWLTLLALGIREGDEVITVPNSFIATAEAISFCGARPVFVDTNPDTYTMNPELIEAAVTSRTRAIIPVHLFGQMSDMDPIMEIARKNELFVIEDACQAHGAEYKRRRAGSIGDAGCFSFYPGKNLGACGEAGTVVTNDYDLQTTLRMLRDHGQTRKYDHAMIGWNGRMDGLQGAILSVKLRYIDQWNEARRKNAHLYNEFLVGLDGVIAPIEANYAKHVYHIYAIRVQNRDVLIDALKAKNIHCAIHYPVPIHLQDAYNSMRMNRGDFPTAETCAKEFVSLPMFPDLSKEQIEYTSREIKHFVASHDAGLSIKGEEQRRFT